MRLLRQENAELRWQGSAFNLIGVDYQRQRDADGNRCADAGRRGTSGAARRPQYFALAQSEFVSARRRTGHRACRWPATRTAARCASKFSIIAGAPREFLTPYVAGLYTAPAASRFIELDDAKLPLRLQPRICQLLPPAASTSIAASARSARRCAWAFLRKSR